MDNLTYFSDPEQQGWRDTDGNLHGEYRRFNEDGSVQMVAHYDHGYRNGLSVEHQGGDDWEILIWKNHRIAQVVHAPLESDPEELIGMKYMFLGR